MQFEGAPVYRLYHFGDLTSFVNSRMLERIDLYPGNFSARYGRKMGGIIDVGIRDPKTDRFHGMVDINVVDSQMLIETPIGKPVALAVAAKRSYVDFFIDKLLPEEIGVTAAPVYYDYQLIGTYRPTDKDRLRAMVYGSYDNFKLTLKNPDDKRSQHPRQPEPRRPASTGRSCCGSARWSANAGARDQRDQRPVPASAWRWAPS